MKYAAESAPLLFKASEWDCSEFEIGERGFGILLAWI